MIWRVENWGTKWNAYEYYENDEDEIQFETAWSNPEPIIRKLAEMYPDVQIEHWWADEDLGNNCGYRCYEGDRVEEDYYEVCSQEAYETYIKCWGDTNCLYLNDDEEYVRRTCEECPECK